MSKDNQLKIETAKAKAELADVKERGAAAIGGEWKTLRQELFTREEIVESNLRVALISEMVKARHARGITQKKLEELSGVKQPIIARMERGTTIPQLDTILKVLVPLGKTLYLGDL
ncbi:hypothetical protein FACS18948_7220 [Clostridia bacterium]|nr:hypothetical protein FACS18948_7220 [Clostridia bacterium]